VHELSYCPHASEHATPMPVALIVKVKIITFKGPSYRFENSISCLD